MCLKYDAKCRGRERDPASELCSVVSPVPIRVRRSKTEALSQPSAVMGLTYDAVRHEW